MDDTLRQLVQAFDRMAESYRLIADRVGRRLDELEDVHASLKDYVRQLEERSTQLSESNTGLCARVAELEAQAQDLRQLNEGLQALDRQKSDFLTTLSHQIRTPLTVIEGSLRLLFHEEGVEPAARHEFLTMAHQHVDRLIRLVGNFLSLTRIESGQIVGERRELDLSLLVKRTVDRLRPVAINRHIRIDLEQPPKRVLVQGDIEMLESVLINLVDNAVKFSGQGKVVQIKVEETPTEALVHCMSRRSSSRRTRDGYGRRAKSAAGASLALPFREAPPFYIRWRDVHSQSGSVPTPDPGPLRNRHFPMTMSLASPRMCAERGCCSSSSSSSTGMNALPGPPHPTGPTVHPRL